MKKNLLVVLAALASLITGAEAASVGLSGYINDFSTLPAASDWSTYSIGGAGTTSSTSNEWNTSVQAVPASTVNGALTLEAANPVTQWGTAVWSSTGQSVQTRPTGNNGTLLMLTLQNNSGADAGQATISYDYAEAGTALTEQVPGQLVYYSLTGAANSWTVIPELCTATMGRRTANISLSWPVGSTVYFLWADDNADGGTDAACVIDNLSVTLTSALAVPASITQSPANLTVGELTPASFSVTAAGNPPATYQWYRNNVAIQDATSATYTLAETPLAFDQSQFKAVAINTISNVNYAATSGVAVLTVQRDTNPPVLLDAYAVSGSQVQVAFSEPLLPATATNKAFYALSNAGGALTIVGVAQDATLSSVVLTVSPLAPNASHTLVVNGVTDRSAAANAVAPNSSRTFIAYSYVTTNIGSPAWPGSTVTVSGGYDITGGGTNIGGASDQFMFQYQQKSGDFDVKVRVAGLSLSDAWAKAGLIARENLNANAAFAGVFATPSIGGVFAQYRASAGASATTEGNSPVNYPYTWLRLKRAGNVFIVYSGFDGVNWVQLASPTVTMAASIYVGYAVCANVGNQTAAAQFRDYGEAGGGSVVALKTTREPLGPVSRRTGLAITEIMYHPRRLPGTNNSLEFVEIFNSNPFYEDISGYRLTGDIDFTFPTNTLLPAGAFAVVARYPEVLQSYYQIGNVFGPFTNNLPNNQGNVRLRNRTGGLLLDVNYSSAPPWPVAPDGTGHSLVLARPSYGVEDPRAWDASSLIDGSPGRVDPVVMDPAGSVVINEFSAHGGAQEDFIELYNCSTAPVDLSGAWLTDERGIMIDSALTNKFRLPAGTVLGPRGFKVYYESELNFALDARGGTILLVNSNLNRVIDCAAYEGQAFRISSGRAPDGSPGFRPLVRATPGTNNAAVLRPDIVINELMYQPISGNNDDEFIELYNQGTNTINVGGWTFTAGVDFVIPTNRFLAPGAYLVVAKNATNLFASYPHLNPGNTVGDYKGSLANGGERLALSQPEIILTTNIDSTITTNVSYIVVNEVSYGAGGRWGQWANGGGSSLELMDPRSDNRLAANWADSDETLKSQWTNCVWSEMTDNVFPRGGNGAILNSVQVFLLAEGEALMDNVDVHSGIVGPNLVLNSSFDAGLASWLIQGNHARSSLEPAGSNNPSPCLHLRASAGGDNGANRAQCNLSATLSANVTNTIGARLRWLRGDPNVVMRVHGGGLEAVFPLPVPRNLGTPGLPNSRAVANAGPAIWDVAHAPVLPPASANVVVTARANDPDGIGRIQLRYRIEPATTYTAVDMVDNGGGGDAVAGDGLYSATIPGQPAGTLAAFYVAANDSATPAATNTFPAPVAGRECLVRFGDPAMPGNLGTYRLWMTAANVNIWSTRERLSNEPLDGTFVYGNSRAVYNSTARYRGSPFIRGGGPTAPTSGIIMYIWETPPDEPFLGANELNLDSQEHGGRDTTVLREPMAFWMVSKLGLPFSYQRFIHVVINGVTDTSRGTPGYIDVQQPNADYIDQWFDKSNRGDLFKIDDWFEYNSSATSVSMDANKSASLENFTTVGGVKKKARYRWSWEKKALHGMNDDYSRLFDAVDAVNAPDATYVSAVESTINIEEWLTMFALRHCVGDWDSYSYNRGKNAFVYCPTGEKFTFLQWDIDFALGCTSGDGPTANLFQVNVQGAGGENNMPEISRMFNHPYFRRIYLGALQRIAEGPMSPATYSPVLEACYRGLAANGINSVSPYVGSGAQGISIPAWMDQRRANILATVPQATFSVTTPSYRVSGTNLVKISGTAPVTVKSVRVNGQLYAINWGANYTSWSLTNGVQAATNVLVIEGCDYQDQPIAGMAATNTFIYTGARPQAPGAVVFSEIMYKPARTNAEYVEIFNSASDFTFDLHNWRVNGLNYTFPFGAYIMPQQSLLLVKDRAAFTTAYGNAAAAAIADVYGGVLKPEGETLSLMMPAGDNSGGEVVVDRVRYEPDAPWPASANGQGAALQLIDPRQDNGRIINWSEGAGWQFISFTMSNKAPMGANLQVRTKSAGELYLDDFRVETGFVAGGSTNLVVNGDFESPLAGTWLLGSNVLGTTLSTEFKHSGNASLRLVASARANTIASGLSQLPLPLTTGETYTVSFWFLPSATVTNVDVFVGYTISSNNIPTLDGYYNKSPGATNPVAESLPALPALWLNEVQPENLTGPVDNFGDRDPWVEIFNNGTNAVSLDGWYLADNYTNLAQWPFPAGTVINPGEFKVIWADGQPQQTQGANLHTSFRLAPTNGQLALVTPLLGELKVFDYLNYTNLAADASYGDYPDGQMFYRHTFVWATPGGSNNPALGLPVIKINEWMSDNATITNRYGTFNDWFELYNPGTNSVDLTGLYLTDNATNQFQYQIPPGYSVPPRGFLLVWADGLPARNSTNDPDLHVNFQLSRNGEAIGLYGPDGTVMDLISFTAMGLNQSLGRYPDGGDWVFIMSQATPKAPNVADVPLNSPPVLGVLSNRVLVLGETLAFTVTATDTDFPSQTLTFTLEPSVAGNASLASGGSFTWTPTKSQAPSTNVFTVRVTDSGLPPASSSGSFIVIVGLPPQFEGGTARINGDQLSLGFQTTPGKTYQAQSKNSLNDPQWSNFGEPQTATGTALTISDNLRAQPARFYRVIVVQ